MHSGNESFLVLLLLVLIIPSLGASYNPREHYWASTVFPILEDGEVFIELS